MRLQGICLAPGTKSISFAAADAWFIST